MQRRAGDDRHLRAAGLHREITALGYTASYPAFTRELRGHGAIDWCRTCKPRQPHSPSWQQHPPQLPVRVPPITGETISSYLSRLAAASHLPDRNITSRLPAWFAARAAACDDLTTASLLRPGDAAHLAALTGISESDLRHALPALSMTRGSSHRPAILATIACRRCAARHGQQDPVPVHLPAHRRTCERHRTWLGRVTQVDVTTAPEIIAASRQASRLARKHGVTRLVLAETTARQETPGGPTPGDAPRHSPWPALAWIPGTPTRPRRRPTPRRSKRQPRSSAHRAHCPPGRNNWQNMARSTRRADFNGTTPARFLPLEKARAGQRAGPGRFIWHRTGEEGWHG